MKFHIRTRLIESFRTISRTWLFGEEKFHFPPFHTLRQLKRDEMRFHHLGGSYSFKRGTVRKLNAGFGGVGKIWRPSNLWSRSYKRLELHTQTHRHTHTRRLIYTSRTRVIPRTFKGFWKVFRCDNFVEGRAKFG